MHARRGIGFLLVLFLGVSCRGWGGSSAGTSPTSDEDVCTGSTVMAFDPRPSVRFLPWPTDLLTVADAGSHTGKRVHVEPPYPPIVSDVLKGVEFVRDSLGATDGFSTTERIFAPVGGDLATESLPDLASSSDPASSVQVIVTDETSPHYGERATCFVRFRSELKHLVIEPMLPLDEATRYTVVVTADARGTDGAPVCSSEEFRYLKRTEPDPTIKYYDDLEPVREAYQAVFERLEALPSPIPRQRAAVAFEFTTADATTDMVRVSQYILDRAGLFPPEAVDFAVNAPGDGNLNAVVTGTFPSPNFRDDDGVFLYDPTWQTPYSIHDELLEFLLLLPEPRDGAAAQPFPVVLCLHGINSSKEMCYGLSDQLRRRGFALIAIDFVDHGSRGADEGSQDGFKFIDFTHPLVMRDNIRQTVADELQTVQFLKTLSDLDVYPYDADTGTAGDGIPDLDLSHIFLFGHSLGGILSPMLLALSPDLNAAVASPPAGAWTDIAMYSYYADVAESVLGVLIGLQGFPEPLRIMLDLAGIVLEPASNVNYIRHVTLDPLPIAGGAKDFLFQEAIGDQTLPNESTDILAFDGGFPLADPYVQPAAGLTVEPTPVAHFGMMQYAHGGHGFYWGGADRDLARLQAEVFWATYLHDGVGTIIDPNDPTQIPDWYEK